MPSHSGQPGAAARRAGAAAADACKLEITGNDQMQYDKKQLAVPRDLQASDVTIHHGGQLPAAAMGHDWVFVATPDLTAVAMRAWARGWPTTTSGRSDKRVIAHTKIVGGGQSASVTFSTAASKQGRLLIPVHLSRSQRSDERQVQVRLK